MKPNALLTLLGLSLAVGTFFWWRSRRPEAADESLRLSSESEEDIQLFPTIVSPLATVIDIGPTPPLSSLSTPTQRQSRTALNISRIAAMVGDNTIGMPSWNPQKHSGHWYAVSKGGGGARRWNRNRFSPRRPPHSESKNGDSDFQRAHPQHVRIFQRTV